MAEETRERLACGPILKAKSPLFAALTEDEIFEVLARCTQQEFEAGVTILQDGETGSSMSSGSQSSGPSQGLLGAESA